MAAAFDPYHKWLGIPPAEQPPNHYRLLAINLFESDPDVIEGAADQRMVHLRSLQTGQHAELTQKLLNKISAARLCLLRPDKKKEYDDELRAQLAKAAPPPAPPAPPPGGATPSDTPSEVVEVPVVFKTAPVAASPLDFINTPAPRAKSGSWEPEPLPVGGRGTSKRAFSSGYSARKAKKSQTPPILAIVAVVAVFGIGIIVYATSQGGSDPETPVPNNEVPKAVATKIEKHHDNESLITKPKTVPHSQPATITAPSTEPANSSKTSGTEVASLETNHPKPEPTTTPEKPPKPKESPTPKPAPPPTLPPAEPADKRKPVPDPPALTKAQATVHDVLKDEFAKAITGEARANLIRKLIKLASETNDDPNQRYAMGAQAMELAIKAGDTDLAFQAIDGLNSYFAVDGWGLKAHSLSQLSHQAKTPQLRKEVATQALAMTDSALAAEHYDAAVELSAVAATMSESVGEPLLRDQAHEARAKAQRMQNAAQEYKTAKEKLAAHPGDAEASLSIGRFLCFQKDDWKTGLPFLAHGSDTTLKGLAELEATPPATPPEQAKLADAWWADAEKSGDKNSPFVKPLFARAKYWYQEAIPGLSGLALEKAQKRSSEDAGAADMGGKIVFLDDLPEQDVSIGYGVLGKHGETGLPNRDDAAQPKDVVFHGTPVKHSLFMHPPDKGNSKLSYTIDRKFHMFTAIVGLRDGADPKSAVTFELRGDGRLLWASHPIRRSGESQEVSVSVGNFKSLQLQVNCSGDSGGCWATWFNPMLKK